MGFSLLQWIIIGVVPFIGIIAAISMMIFMKPKQQMQQVMQQPIAQAMPQVQQMQQPMPQPQPVVQQQNVQDQPKDNEDYSGSFY